METGNPVLVEWVLDAIRGPESFLDKLATLLLFLCSFSPGEGRVQRHVKAKSASFLGAFLKMSLNNLPSHLIDCVT